MSTKVGNKYRYEATRDILYRIFETVKGDIKTVTKQIVVPKKYQDSVMSLAHESITDGHLSVQKTLDRNQSSFH